MKRGIGLMAGVFPLLAMAGCANAKYEEGQRSMQQPIHCATAEADMDALVEIHDLDEAVIARAAGATLIGVNNRNLMTFATDLGVAEGLASTVQEEGIVAVAESGIHTPQDAERMQSAGYDAILVGEALVVADDPAATLARLVGRS